ncbi:hypothetical protein [Streptomyces glaucosporus]|uniref:hypothetical protein n=1 Tax=Streptomyces glaucosporus TaxID=284044 RepID=UPI0031DC30F1
MSRKAVDGWWAKWQADGREALVMRPRGKPVGVHQALGEAEQTAVRHRRFSSTGPVTWLWASSRGRGGWWVS